MSDGVQHDLIFDLGLHRGEDTAFYLKKGFRVVGVDANPVLCAAVAREFAGAVAAGRLTIVNRAIADVAGTVAFHEPEHSVWGTIDPAWAERNRRQGHASRVRTVEATTVAALLAEHGVPYYAKIDIEGMDRIALAGFGSAAARPRYLSIESDKRSLAAVAGEIAAFADLGYDRFKVVAQHRVPDQRLPDPPREGAAAAHRFAEGSSGAFGAEAPGDWLSADAALAAYRPIFRRYALIGDDGWIRGRWPRALAHRLGLRAGWYDTHARLSDDR